jgi:hypothetical protein
VRADCSFRFLRRLPLLSSSCEDLFGLAHRPVTCFDGCVPSQHAHLMAMEWFCAAGVPFFFPLSSFLFPLSLFSNISTFPLGDFDPAVAVDWSQTERTEQIIFPLSLFCGYLFLRFACSFLPSCPLWGRCSVSFGNVLWYDVEQTV